jgi:DNA-binding IclR family transcriptional regulator
MLAKRQKARNSNLLKGLAVLETMAAEAREFSLAEVAELTGLDKSHACRLLQSLVEAGYVVRNSQNRRYHIGLRTLELSSSILARMDVYTLGQAYLREVSDRLRSSSCLGVLHCGKVLTVATVYPAGVYAGKAPGFGSVMDLDDSAMGKVLLAYMALEDQQRVLDGDERLDLELEAVSRSGLATILKPKDADPAVVGVAAPVRNSDGQVIAALGASTSKEDWDALDQETFRNTVRNAAGGLSFALGHAAARLDLAHAGP